MIRDDGGFSRSPRLERWLKNLIDAYQDRLHRPRRTYTNLTRLSRPTQLYAISLKGNRSDLMVTIVVHDKATPNGTTKAFVVGSLNELADFADSADRLFGTDRLAMGDSGWLDWVNPKVGPAPRACVMIAEWRDQLREEQAANGAQSHGHQTLLSMPPGAYWWVRHKGVLPEPRKFLAAIGKKPTPRTRPVAQEAPQPSPETELNIHAAFSEPPIWLGDPPFPTARDQILNRPVFIMDSRFVCGAPVNNVPTYVYGNGLIVAATPNRLVARSVINQVFAAFSRSGVISYAVSDAELITISKFDPWSGAITGSNSPVTPRNRRFSIGDRSSSPEISLVFPETIAPAMLERADECARNNRLAVLSLRLLDATTLFERGWFTEAFVVSWSLIESSVEAQFTDYWYTRQVSKTRIDAMTGDWTASQKIDLLLAADILTLEKVDDLHRLRKIRNSIVHELHQVSQREASDCLRVASEMNPLPHSEGLPKPRYARL